MSARATCSICGGELIDAPVGSPSDTYAYNHTEMCDIRMRREYNRGIRRMRVLLANGSLGSPGAQALIKVGRLSLLGATDAEIEESLTLGERMDAKLELSRLAERDLGR